MSGSEKLSPSTEGVTKVSLNCALTNWPSLKK